MLSEVENRQLRISNFEAFGGKAWDTETGPGGCLKEGIRLLVVLWPPTDPLE